MILFRVGQQLKLFSIYRKKPQIDDRGRVTYSKNENLEYIGEIKGSLSAISQKEKYKWKQIEHTASHTIVVRGRITVQSEDILVHDGKRYDVESVEEPGEVAIFTIVYCRKREEFFNYGGQQTGNTGNYSNSE